MGRSVLVRMTETGEWLEKVRCGSLSHSKIKGCLRTLGHRGGPSSGGRFPNRGGRAGGMKILSGVLDWEAVPRRPANSGHRRKDVVSEAIPTEHCLDIYVFRLEERCLAFSLQTVGHRAETKSLPHDLLRTH
jgi:hypothetical protein